MRDYFNCFARFDVQRRAGVVSLSFVFCFIQKRKERGRIDLENVHCIEIVHTLSSSEENSKFPFQIGYQEGSQDYVLYLLASKEQDRSDWILALRSGK